MKNPDYIKQAWNDRSKKYGKRIEGVLPKSLDPVINEYLHKWMYEQIEKYINKDKKLKILDLGCGYGRLSKHLLNDFPKIKTVGIDIAKQYVNIYNKELSPRGKAIQGDIKNLPFISNSFDLIFIATSLMYLIDEKDQEKCIKEIARVLKKGGRFIFIERNPVGHSIITMGGLIPAIRGQKYREIPSVSFTKDYLMKLIQRNLGKVDQTHGLPIWTITLPIQFVLLNFGKNTTKTFLNFINKLDDAFNRFDILSLYIFYTGIKKSK